MGVCHAKRDIFELSAAFRRSWLARSRTSGRGAGANRVLSVNGPNFFSSKWYHFPKWSVHQHTEWFSNGRLLRRRSRQSGAERIVGDDDPRDDQERGQSRFRAARARKGALRGRFFAGGRSLPAKPIPRVRGGSRRPRRAARRTRPQENEKDESGRDPARAGA